MTEINTGNSTNLAARSEVHKRFANHGHTKRTIGVEGEFFLVDRDTLDYIDPALLEKLQTQLSDAGIPSTTEAAGVLEYRSDPVDATDVHALVAKTQIAEKAFVKAAAEHNLIMLPSSVPPFTTLDEALGKMRPRQRIVDMTQTVREALPTDALRIGYMSASTQISLTYRGNDELYRSLHRGHALTPLLLNLFASDTGRLEGARVGKHIRSELYNAYTTHELGMPAYLETARSGAELIANHVDAVCKAPMLYYYDHNGEMHKGKQGALTETFNTLAVKGLGTEANFTLSESFMYPDIKLKPLPGDAGYRLEFRTPDSAPGTMGAATALVTALVVDDKGGAAFDALLRKYGFKGDFPSDTPLLRQNRARAVDNPGALDNVAFGNGTLRGFVRDAGALALDVLGRNSLAAKALTPYLQGDFQPQGQKYRAMDDASLRAHLKR